MSQVTNTGNLPTATDPNVPKRATTLQDLDSSQFLKLLITELSNQDPLNPMDNTQMVQQISTIREIASTTQLSDTLNTVTTGQNLMTATGLIGKKINAITDAGNNVTGLVEKATIEVNSTDNSRRYRLHIGADEIDLKNVREVLPN